MASQWTAYMGCDCVDSVGASGDIRGAACDGDVCACGPMWVGVGL